MTTLSKYQPMYLSHLPMLQQATQHQHKRGSISLVSRVFRASAPCQGPKSYSPVSFHIRWLSEGMEEGSISNHRINRPWSWSLNISKSTRGRTWMTRVRYEIPPIIRMSLRYWCPWIDSIFQGRTRRVLLGCWNASWCRAYHKGGPKAVMGDWRNVPHPGVCRECLWLWVIPCRRRGVDIQETWAICIRKLS